MFGLTEKAMGIIIAALIVALAGMWTYCTVSTNILRKELETANQKIGDLTVQVATQKASKALLDKAFQTQNAEIDSLKSNQDKVANAAVAAVEAEKKRAATWKARYAEILSAPKEGSSCDNLATKMSGYFLERHREAGELP